jgi:phosphoglycerate dehydrogenase-like enzyme
MSEQSERTASSPQSEDAVSVGILDDYQGVALTLADWSTLEPGVEITVLREHIVDQDRLARALYPFDVVVVMRERTPLGAELLARLPRLRLVATTGRRNSSIDTVAAHELGITVCGTESQASAAVELTWALIFASARGIVTENNNVRAGGWQTTVGTALRGKQLGILGLGRIGSEVARIGAAIGMSVVAWSQNLTAARAAEAGARLVSFEDLLSGSDIVTIHQVLSDRTLHLIGAPELALMKPTARLINASRAPIVDTDALVEALGSRAIAGAGVDVFDLEPLPADHPLRFLDNAVVTPHLGYVTDDNYGLFFGQTIENISAFLAGTPLRVLS